MSGRRKTAQSLEELPDEKSTHRIGRVTVLRGANQCDVEFDDKQSVMVLIPTKFHKMVWIKRGDFVIVDVYPSTKTDHKARGEVAHVLTLSNIKELKKDKKWPTEFDATQSTESKNAAKRFDLPPSESEGEEEEGEKGEEEEEDDNDDDIPVNPNRRVVEMTSDDEKPRPVRRRYRGYVPSDEEDDEWDSEDDEEDDEDDSDDE